MDILEAMSLLLRGAWIEMGPSMMTQPGLTSSLPSRGAWIEISLLLGFGLAGLVAPLPGSVDRNGKLLPWEKFLADPRTFPAVERSGSFGLP